MLNNPDNKLNNPKLLPTLLLKTNMPSNPDVKKIKILFKMLPFC